MFCQQCGKELPDGTHFCSQCGASVSAGSTSSPKVEPASTAPPPNSTDNSAILIAHEKKKMTIGYIIYTGSTIIASFLLATIERYKFNFLDNVFMAAIVIAIGVSIGAFLVAKANAAIKRISTVPPAEITNYINIWKLISVAVSILFGLALAYMCYNIL